MGSTQKGLYSVFHWRKRFISNGDKQTEEWSDSTQ